MYIEINTGFILTYKELYKMFVDEWDGDDPLNPRTFSEFLDGGHYERDYNGGLFPCYFRKTKI